MWILNAFQFHWYASRSQFHVCWASLGYFLNAFQGHGTCNLIINLRMLLQVGGPGSIVSASWGSWSRRGFQAGVGSEAHAGSRMQDAGSKLRVLGAGDILGSLWGYVRATSGHTYMYINMEIIDNVMWNIYNCFLPASEVSEALGRLVTMCKVKTYPRPHFQARHTDVHTDWYIHICISIHKNKYMCTYAGIHMTAWKVGAG